MFIMCHSFMIQAHGAIKYIVNMSENVCFCNNNYLLSFHQDITFLNQARVLDRVHLVS